MAFIELRCSFCNKSFQRAKWKYNSQMKQGNQQFFCDRTCYRNSLKGKQSKNLTSFPKVHLSTNKLRVKQLKKNGKTHQEIAFELDIPLGSISYLLRQK